MNTKAYKAIVTGLYAILLLFAATLDNANAAEESVGHYHLDEGSGTVLQDSSGNARNGAITNGSWAVTGVYGRALDFGAPRAAPMWASIPGMFPFHDPAAGGSNEASLSFWVKPVDNQHRTLFWTREGPYTPDANRFHIYSGGDFTDAPPGTSILGVDYKAPTGDAITIFSRVVPLGQWTNVVMIRRIDVSVAKYIYSIYFNGILDATSEQLVGNLPDATSWSLGAPMDYGFDSSAYWFNGQLDEIQLWTRALTPEEVATLQPNSFRTFSLRAEFNLGPKANDDSYWVRGWLKLADNSNGIDPLTEPVTIQVGSFSHSIPAGSFKQEGSAYKYVGAVGRSKLDVALWPQAKAGTYWFKSCLKNGSLGATTMRPQVQLAIGDDQGQATLDVGYAKFGKGSDGQKWVFPPAE